MSSRVAERLGMKTKNVRLSLIYGIFATLGAGFLIYLIVSSIFIFAYSISVITEYILARNTLEHLKIKRMKKKIQQLSNHVVLCGYGRNGKRVAAKLKAAPFTIFNIGYQI